jgi:molybdate transport system regulatory protein
MEVSSMAKTPFAVRSKVWIVDEAGNVVLGLGRLRILQAVRRHGSIHAAAAELKMSYRAVWGRIKTPEQRLGRPLLVRRIGGATGGGSRLTPFAEALVESFEQLQWEVNREADRICLPHLVRLFSQD